MLLDFHMHARSRPSNGSTIGAGDCTDDNLLSMTVRTGATAATYYAVKDHLGTVHALTDGSGAVVESYRFDAWGNVLEVCDASNTPLSTKYSPLGNRYLWQGREYSWQSGLYYFRARWYDPRIGRWLSNDPIGISGGLNQYVFCGNDPVNGRDPYGLRNWRKFWVSAAGLGANAVGAGVGLAAAETGVGVVLAVYCSANCGVQFGNMMNALGNSDVPAPAGIVGAVAENVQAIAATDNDYVRYGTDIIDIGVPFVLSGRIDWARLPTRSGTLFNLPTTVFRSVPINPQVAYPILTTVFQGADAGFGLYNAYDALQNEYWRLYQKDEECEKKPL